MTNANGELKEEYKSKRVKKGYFYVIEETTFKWFLYARKNNLPISCHSIKTVALKVASMTNQNTFAASNGWLHRWKNRHGILCKAINGEKFSVDISAIKEWKEDTLYQIIHLMRYTMSMKLAFIIKLFETKHCA